MLNLKTILETARLINVDVNGMLMFQGESTPFRMDIAYFMLSDIKTICSAITHERVIVMGELTYTQIHPMVVLVMGSNGYQNLYIGKVQDVRETVGRLLIEATAMVNSTIAHLEQFIAEPLEGGVGYTISTNHRVVVRVNNESRDLLMVDVIKNGEIKHYQSLVTFAKEEM